MSKLLLAMGLCLTISSITACGKQAQAETTTVAETTMHETTAEPTTEEAKTEPTEESYSGQRENGDAFVKLDLPTLSTGKEFDETAAMTYEVVYSQWEQTSAEDRGYIGREGLKENIKMIEGLSEQEVDEVADYILSKLPLPVQEASKQESKSAPQPTQSTQSTQSSNNETKAAPKETQASVQPTTPQPQPTQSQQSDSALPPEVQAEIDRRAAEREKEVQDYKDAHGGSYINEAGPDAEYGAIDGEININGF